MKICQGNLIRILYSSLYWFLLFILRHCPRLYYNTFVRSRIKRFENNPRGIYEHQIIRSLYLPQSTTICASIHLYDDFYIYLQRGGWFFCIQFFREKCISGRIFYLSVYYDIRRHWLYAGYRRYGFDRYSSWRRRKRKSEPDLLHDGVCYDCPWNSFFNLWQRVDPTSCPIVGRQ